VWRTESTCLIAGIARVTRDIGIAEELAQDALEAALQQCQKSRRVWAEETQFRNALRSAHPVRFLTPRIAADKPTCEE
jgi:hypothetical protein